MGIFVGPHGIRPGWSAIIFFLLMTVFIAVFGFLFSAVHLVENGGDFTPVNALFSKLYQVLAVVAAAAIVARIEHRTLLDYNLRDVRGARHFFSGLLVGFAALSALVGALSWGGWLRFGPSSLHGAAILRFAAAWGAVFLLVACMEEGTMRCVLQSILARGMNFWWAAGLIACMCALLFFRTRGSGAWGIYIMALLGLAPCLLLHLRKSRSSGFWQAAWFTSTLFGFAHTGNNGENWIGIFAAAFIGFVFCVSIWATGSAWWAIGCHAAWDWAETYFYGTADSGFVAPGHLLSTSPAGNPLWSGGTDGPEGSLLIIPIVLLILAWILLIYRRPGTAVLAEPVAREQLAG